MAPVTAGVRVVVVGARAGTGAMRSRRSDNEAVGVRRLARRISTGLGWCGATSRGVYASSSLAATSGCPEEGVGVGPDSSESAGAGSSEDVASSSSRVEEKHGEKEQNEDGSSPWWVSLGNRALEHHPVGGRRCKLDPGLKALPAFTKKFNLNEDKRAFSTLEPWGFFSLRPLQPGVDPRRVHPRRRRQRALPLRVLRPRRRARGMAEEVQANPIS